MNRKILIIKEEANIWTYLLEDEEIVEINCQEDEGLKSGSHELGNIYIGKVKKIVDNLGAAFVEIEPGLECYYDMSLACDAIFTKKIGKKPLCIDDELVVQLSKEAVKGKAPTVTSNISFTGYYSVLTTGNSKIGVSTKISKKKREQLKELLAGYENQEYGLIIRTNGKDIPFEIIEKEINGHIDDYNELKAKSTTRTCFSCLKESAPSYITNIRNVYLENLEEIVVDDADVYKKVMDFFQVQNISDAPKIRLYEDSMLSLSSLYNTRKVLERALNEQVWLKNGAYLVIQPTEALTVIDVNSGKYEKKEGDQVAALNINLEAAKEVAKQLRLRNISGIVIIDFINMDNNQDIDELIRRLKGYLANDPIQTTFVDVTALQLFEITRKKIRKPLWETLTLRGPRV